MSKSDSFYLEHILDQACLLAETVGKTNEIEFSHNRTLQNSFCRSLEIIGEASKGISPEFAAKYPHIPWHDMAKTRDKIIHQYFDVDQATIWDTVINDIIPLIPDLKKILAG